MNKGLLSHSFCVTLLADPLVSWISHVQMKMKQIP